MNNNTCGECKYWYAESVGKCRIFKHFNIPANRRFCSEFEQWEKPKPTNGDKIRQMSNEELAKLIVPKVIFCDGCPVKCAEKDIPQSKINPFGADVIEDVCTKRVESWLNAPAESEVNNG